MNIFIILVMSFAFTEDTALWERIDALNAAVPETPEELEALFRSTVETALSPDLASQMEDLRADAFATDNYDLLDTYIHRASPCISITEMGESTLIGIDVEYFQGLSDPGTQAYEFFDLALDGFYVNGMIGTAYLPMWMERTESSAQAEMDPEIAGLYAGIWQDLSYDFRGYYLTVAQETIRMLGGSVDLGEEALADYYSVYRDPLVLHLRVAFDSWLEGEPAGVNADSTLRANLDKYIEFLDDHFVVLTMEEGIMGGYVFQLISQESPDRVFEAWVYEMAGGGIELRGFGESAEFTRENAEGIAEMYGEFMNDTEHSI